MSTNNMKLWDSVCKTDPNHTKKVSQRGGFTAIDAHYQIQEATKAFGPVGVGWGYTVERMERLEGLIVVYVTLWHGSRENSFGPVLGCAEMFGKRADSDAPKKATTDAITKGLSQLGFNADVFLGKFDDNKYVQEVTKEFAAAKPHQWTENDHTWINAIKAGTATLDQIEDPEYRELIKGQVEK